MLYVHALWKTLEIGLAAHAVDSAATGFNKEAAFTSSAPPCMHGLLKRDEFLMRWENATVVDIRRKKGFAICLEAGRNLRIFPRCKSLNYAPLGGVSRIPEPGPEQRDYFLSFLSHKIVALLADEKKAAGLGWLARVRGTEQRRVDPTTAASTAASHRRAAVCEQ